MALVFENQKTTYRQSVLFFHHVSQRMNSGSIRLDSK